MNFMSYIFRYNFIFYQIYKSYNYKNIILLPAATKQTKYLCNSLIEIRGIKPAATKHLRSLFYYKQLWSWYLLHVVFEIGHICQLIPIVQLINSK
jgi:hypothetical protein